MKGFLRSGRRGVLPRRVVRIAAVVLFFVLGSVTAMGSADAAALPQATVKFSSVRAFVTSLFAQPVSLPRQESGTAAGTGGAVSAAATRAGKGTGHPPGKGVGEVPAYSQFDKAAKPGPSGKAHIGFDAKTSTRNAHKSNAFSTWFDNADGSYTVKTSQTPMNYRTADGSWQPIDAGLVRGTDGRLHQKANGIGVSFAGGAAGATARLRPGAAVWRLRVLSDLRTRHAPASSTGPLVSVSLGGSDQVGGASREPRRSVRSFPVPRRV